MAPARWAEHQLMLRYVDDLSRRQVPLKKAHRRFRTVRAFARHLSPRSLLEASADDLRRWAGDTSLDKVTRGRRRADIADFYQWCRVRTVLPLAQLDDVRAPPAEPPDVAVEPSDDTDVALGDAPAVTEADAPSLSRRLGLVLVVSAVGILWMTAAALPHRVAREEEPETSTTTAAPSTTAPTTTTTSVRPPPEVSVVAVNASGVMGRAATVTETLRSARYAVVAPQLTSRVRPTSSVYWTPGYEGEAQAVATALGLPPTAVEPLPEPPVIAGVKGANVVVLVGRDL